MELLYVVSAMGFSVILNLILHRFNISQIIGYILTGTIIVYLFDLRHVSDSHTLELVGEFGIVFLMFTIGLEVSLARLKTMKSMVFLNGTLQLFSSATLFFFISYYLFNSTLNTALIVSLSFALSSTAVVLSYLKESRKITTPYGQYAMGILIFQDIAVIPILLLIGFLSGGNGSLQEVLINTILSAFLVIGLLFVVGKRLMTFLLQFSANSKNEELFVGSVLIIVMAASLLAHSAGFTYSLGAFVAGMIIAETKYHYKIESDIAPFKNLLLGTFFVTVGMKIEVEFLTAHLLEISILLFSVLLLKTVMLFSVMRFRTNKFDALKTALALSQVGEFSFAIFALASQNNLMSHYIEQLLVLTVVISMIITPFLITKIDKIVAGLFTHKEIVSNFSGLKQSKNHIIVCGYGSVGRYVAKKLNRLNLNYMIIDNSYQNVKEAMLHNEPIYYGDIVKEKILHAVHAEDASAIIVTIDNPHKKQIICEQIAQYSGKINIIVKIISLQERKMLEHINISRVINGKKVVGELLVDEAIQCRLDP